MKHKNQIFVIAWLAMPAMTAGLSGCSKERPTQAAAPETVSNVQVVAVQKTTVPDWLEAVGTVRAAQTSQLASQIMGNLVEVRAREGGD
jgi:membrane fusion protein, multidrug efflux system